MMKDSWRYEITDAERLWLQACYNHFIEGRDPLVRSLRVSLYPNLPGSFNPEMIDNTLLVGGSQITLLGVLQIEENTQYYELCEKFLFAIKSIILETHNTSEIAADMLPDFDRKEMFSIMTLIGHLGRFWNGYSHDDDGIVKLSIGDDEVYNEYLNYESLELLLDTVVVKREDKDLLYPVAKTVELHPDTQRHPLFRSEIKSVDKKLAFVLMPFTEDWSDSVWKIVKDTTESFGIQCLRADSLYGPIVIEDIWIKINQCAFIIADVTNTNPNVMYEIGLVHAIGKHSILICQDTNHIPFDFRHLRHFFYKYFDGETHGIKRDLKAAIQHIYQEHYPGIIPIT